MRRFTFISTAIALMLVMSTLNAQPGKRGMKRGPEGGMGMRMNVLLDLSDEQAKQIDALRLEHQKEMIPLHSKIQSLQDEYRLMVIDDSKNESQLKKKLSEISAVKEEIQLKMAKHHKAVRSLLDEDQKIKFDQHFLAKKDGRGRHAFRGERGGKRGFRPGCQKDH